MAWKVELSDKAKKSLRKLDKVSASRVYQGLKKISEMENPRLRGRALKGNLKDCWRYRIGNYRVICEIKDCELIVHVIQIGHRREIYDD